MPKPAKSTSTARPRSSLLGASQTNAIVARDLLAAVGEVMLRWGYLESAMLKAVGGSSRTPIVQRWLAMAEPGAEIAEHGRRLAHISAEVAMLEERWLELGTQIEAMTAAG